MDEKFSRARDAEVFGDLNSRWDEFEPNRFRRYWLNCVITVEPGDVDDLYSGALIFQSFDQYRPEIAWFWHGVDQETGAVARGTCLYQEEAMKDAMSWAKGKNGGLDEFATIEMQYNQCNRFWDNVLRAPDRPSELTYIEQIGEFHIWNNVITRERAIELYDWCRSIEGWKDARIGNSSYYTPPLVFQLYRDEQSTDGTAGTAEDDSDLVIPF